MTMTAAHFRALRSYLGLSLTDVASLLDVSPNSARMWDTGRARVPAGVADELLDMHRQTTETVERLARHYETHPHEWPMEIPRTPEDGEAWMPTVGVGWTLDWWKHVGIRVCERVPGLTLDWA